MLQVRFTTPKASVLSSWGMVECAEQKVPDNADVQDICVQEAAGKFCVVCWSYCL